VTNVDAIRMPMSIWKYPPKSVLSPPFVVVFIAVWVFKPECLAKSPALPFLFSKSFTEAYGKEQNADFAIAIQIAQAWTAKRH